MQALYLTLAFIAFTALVVWAHKRDDKPASKPPNSVVVRHTQARKNANAYGLPNVYPRHLENERD